MSEVPFRQAEFQSAITVPQVGSGTEHRPPEMIAKGQAVGHRDVDVAAHPVVGRSHCLSVLDPQVSQVAVAHRLQRPYRLGHPLGGDDDIDVDHRFGGQPGDRGAADVLDRQDHDAVQGVAELSPHRFEPFCPARVIGNHLDAHRTSLPALPPSDQSVLWAGYGIWRHSSDP
ncbi:MAG TPA: hypothetical protein VLB85_02475 [Acidimicrobiia bacterium]|nr:hypothetical protein [Acidimicrobiia bacterium]